MPRMRSRCIGWKSPSNMTTSGGVHEAPRLYSQGRGVQGQGDAVVAWLECAGPPPSVGARVRSPTPSPSKLGPSPKRREGGKGNPAIQDTTNAAVYHAGQAGSGQGRPGDGVRYHRPLMRAAILAVGSELLGTERLDTNSLRLTETLLRHGVDLRRKSVVGDVEEEIAAELRDCLRLPRVDLMLVTGGLGPTADDVTREAVAAALGRSLALDPEVLAGIERRFQALGWTMPEVNRRQALVIAGAEVLANARGSAPGMRLRAGAATIFLFPGVPSELAGMVEDHLEPWLAPRSGGVSRETAVLKVAGLPESRVEERIAPAYDEFGRESITILARPADVRLLATATGPPAERQARLPAMTARPEALVGDAVYSRREEDTLESVVGDLLRAAGATLTVAESCTGGLLGERLTAVAGSSDYFLGGAITYDDRLKTAMLGVPEELLAAHGAVSEAV